MDNNTSFRALKGHTDPGCKLSNLEIGAIARSVSTQLAEEAKSTPSLCSSIGRLLGHRGQVTLENGQITFQGPTREELTNISVTIQEARDIIVKSRSKFLRTLIRLSSTYLITVDQAIVSNDDFHMDGTTKAPKTPEERFFELPIVDDE